MKRCPPIFAPRYRQKLAPEQIVLALLLVDEGQSVPQVADAFGVYETTIYRCLSAAAAAA